MHMLTRLPPTMSDLTPDVLVLDWSCGSWSSADARVLAQAHKGDNIWNNHAFIVHGTVQACSPDSPAVQALQS